MDDRAARRAAFAIGIKAYGTLSIIARAAKQGNVESFHKSVEALKAAGLYLKDNVRIITAYYPSLQEWEEDFKKRRRSP